MKYTLLLLVTILAIAIGVLIFRHYNPITRVSPTSGGCVDIPASPEPSYSQGQPTMKRRALDASWPAWTRSPSTAASPTALAYFGDRFPAFGCQMRSLPPRRWCIR